MKQFVSTVLAETEDVWNGIFQAEGLQLRGADAGAVRRTGAVRPAAMPRPPRARSIAPTISKVYLDTSFFQQLASQFGASGDFAQAYVIAHEVGHHVQNLTGILPKFNEMRQSMTEADANQMSMRVELQADCFAGVWAHFTDQKGILEAGRYRGGAERRAADRRRYAAEEDAGLCRARKLQPRHLGSSARHGSPRVSSRASCRPATRSTTRSRKTSSVSGRR